MKSALLSISLFLGLLLINHPLESAILQPYSPPTVQQQQKEVKEFSQRLNKLINAYNRKKMDNVRVFYEGLKADIRREVAQIKAQTVQRSKIRPTDPDFDILTADLDQQKVRMQRMQFINEYIGQRPLDNHPDNKEQSKEIISLLKEFESLMKEELQNTKKGR